MKNNLDQDNQNTSGWRSIEISLISRILFILESFFILFPLPLELSKYENE